MADVLVVLALILLAGLTVAAFTWNPKAKDPR